MKHRTIFSILYVSFLIVIILTIGEYRSLCSHIQRIRILQNHYYGYLDIVNRIIQMQRVPQSIGTQKSVSHSNKQKRNKLEKRPDKENTRTEQDGRMSDLHANSMTESEVAPYRGDQGVVP